MSVTTDNQIEIIEIPAIHRHTIMSSENGYTVCRFRNTETEEEFVATGIYTPVESKHTTNLLHGCWEIHKSYGRQFHVVYCDSAYPSNKSGIIAYLVSLRVGVGPVRALSIYKAFGDKVWDVIDKTPERLESVPALPKAVAHKLANKLAETRILRQVMSRFMGNTGLSPVKASALIQHFRDETLYIVENEPYRMCEVPGFRFPFVDEIAIAQGISPESPERIQCAAKYILETYNTSGHVCIPHKILFKEMMKVLNKTENGVDMESCKEGVRQLIRMKEFCMTGKSVYLAKHHEQERFIAQRITALVSDAAKVNNVDIFLEQYQRETGIILAEKQAQAVRSVFENTMCVITGGPGTGKSTTTKAILYVHKLIYGNTSAPILLAPTGRAARRLSEVTNFPASTIHSAIGYSVDPDHRTERDVEDDVELQGNLIIVDETSMMDQHIAYLLLKKVPANARLVFVGDPDQLPSVGCGNILHDIIDCGKVPTTKLDVIYRQGKGSPVITNAHKINAGRTDLEYSGTFKFIDCSTIEETFEAACDMYVRCVKAYGLDEVVLLNPYREKTDLCVNRFNQVLQKKVNPLVDGEPHIDTRGITFHAGDKVMQMKNTELAKNGDIGYILSIDTRADPDDSSQKDQVAIIDFGGPTPENHMICTYTKEELRDVDLAYCSTVHKSQGSQYGTVLMVISDVHRAMLRKRIVYTGLTRAVENVAFIGSRKALDTAIQNQDDDIRFSLLASRLYENLNTH